MTKEPRGQPKLVETGMEPEFFITSLAKIELMADGLVRLYLATEKGNVLRLEYTAIVPGPALAEMGRICLRLAAESHNAMTMAPMH